jgi:hypothetical protein
MKNYRPTIFFGQNTREAPTHVVALHSHPALLLGCGLVEQPT